MEDKNLEIGQVVTINIPFTYTIGEDGPISGRIIKTINDAKNEVLAEVAQGLVGEIYLTVS